MKTHQLSMEEISQQGDQPASRGSFCFNLNALRALACLSVICTHIIEYYELRDDFRSLAFSGHMAAYFFFALSGYVLSFSIVKEVRRHLNLDKSEESTQPVPNFEDLSLQIERDEGEEIEQNEVQDSEFSPQDKAERLELSDRLGLEFSQLIAFLKREKQPLLFSVLGKYLWNRTLRIFPLYYGCWCLLKFFSREDTHVRSLQVTNLWKDILLLKIFPGHLWTMRIEMMFSYYVIPVFIIGLCITFSLQKKGFKLASTICLFLMACILLFIALDKMNLEEDIKHPVKLADKFPENLPPFCFGMLAALVNYALEQEFESQQVANSNVQLDENQVEEELISKKERSLFQKSKWSIVCVAVLLRIMMLNPGFSQSFLTASNEIPKWQMANLNSYWYAIFILINDTRGGFWKLMHSNSEAQSLPSRLSSFSKAIYYLGLWSYPIYLMLPISYVTIYNYFEKPKGSLDVSVLSILFCIALGGLADFIIDKMFVKKLILGKCFRFKDGKKTMNHNKFE